MLNKIKYQEIKAARLCTRCGKNKSRTNSLACDSCTRYTNEYKSVKNSRFKCRYYTSKRLGLCVRCRKAPSIRSRVFCHGCLSEDRKVRAFVISYFPQACSCRGCSIDSVNLLTISHLNNDGHEDIRKWGGWKQFHSHLYSILRGTKTIPDGLSLECWNCNSGKDKNSGVCPHTKPVILSEVSRHRKPHKQVIIKYGGKCVGCGETELGFLTIDHINGGGNKEIQDKFRGQHKAFYRHLRDSPVRKDIQVLCWNCNCTKERKSYNE